MGAAAADHGRLSNCEGFRVNTGLVHLFSFFLHQEE